MDFLLQPWPWYIAGPSIALILFLNIFFGKKFGVSSNLETMCSALGASKWSSYFNIKLSEKQWGLVFVLGIALGGFVSSTYLTQQEGIALNIETVKELSDLGFHNADQNGMVPPELFGSNSWHSPKTILLLIVAGFCIGFGSRYAGGCTSGHAITGLSSFQLPSLVAVIGFFIGGLTMIWLLFPLIF